MEDLAADPFYDPAQTTHAEQLAANVPIRPHLTRLDDGTLFPVTGVPVTADLPSVTTLMDSEGRVLALYTQFIGGGEDWLLPPPCDAPPS